MPGMPGMPATQTPPSQPPAPASQQPHGQAPPAARAKSSGSQNTTSMPGMTIDQMDMGGMTMMSGQLGGYSMMRDASGTAWQPDSTPMEGFSWKSGGWTGMVHGYANLVYDHQGGPRGNTKTFSESMFMVMAQHAAGRGTLTCRAQEQEAPGGLSPTAPTIDQPAQLLKQLRRTVHLVEYDQLVLVGGEIGLGVGQLRSIRAAFEVEIDRRSSGADLSFSPCRTRSVRRSRR